MTDLPQYELDDENRQARLQAFAACRDLTDLSNEVALLREMLERVAREGKSVRLAVDIISQLQKCSAAIETSRIRARELISKTDVLRIMRVMSDIIHDELACLPEEQKMLIVDSIVRRVREQAQKEALLLEVETP
jgi:hypothetical protein